MSAAATWKTTNAPIHVKNKTSARARNTNLIYSLPSDLHDITLSADSWARPVGGQPVSKPGPPA